MDKNINGGIKMNENVELLNYIHEDSLMGISSLTTMIRKLNDKDNKIKKLIIFLLVCEHRQQ